MNKRKIGMPIYCHIADPREWVRLSRVKTIEFTLSEDEVKQAITEWLGKHHDETIPEDISIKLAFVHKHPGDPETHSHVSKCTEARLTASNDSKVL